MLLFWIKDLTGCFYFQSRATVYRSHKRNGGKIPLTKTYQHSFSTLTSVSSTSFLPTPFSLFPLQLHCSLLHLPLSQKSTSSASSEASETCQSVSECNSPTAVSTARISYRPTCLAKHTYLQTSTHARCCAMHFPLIVIYGLKKPVGSSWQPQCSLTWTTHGCGALWLRLICPFRSMAHAHPSVPSALLFLTLAPSGLYLS